MNVIKMSDGYRRIWKSEEKPKHWETIRRQHKRSEKNKIRNLASYSLDVLKGDLL